MVAVGCKYSSFHFIFHYPYITQILPQHNVVVSIFSSIIQEEATTTRTRTDVYAAKTRQNFDFCQYWGCIRVILGLSWEYIGIMEKKMESTIVYWW